MANARRIKRNTRNKNRRENIRGKKRADDKAFNPRQYKKVISLNDDDRLEVGDLTVFIVDETDNGEPMRAEIRPVMEADYMTDSEIEAESVKESEEP